MDKIELYKTFDGKIFHDIKIAQEHEQRIKEYIIDYFKLKLDINQFNEKIKEIKQKGLKYLRAGFSAYKVDDNNMFYIEDEGQTLVLIYNGFTYIDSDGKNIQLLITDKKFNELLKEI